MPKNNNIILRTNNGQGDFDIIEHIRPLASEWVNVTRVTTGNQALTGSNGNVGNWSNSANSVPISTIGSPASFYLKFNMTLPAGGGHASMIGLGLNETNNAYQDVNYAIYINQRPTHARVYIYESGTYRGLFYNGANGSLNGANFEICYNAGQVEYFYNGTSIRTVGAPTGNYYIDSSFYGNAAYPQAITYTGIEICEK